MQNEGRNAHALDGGILVAILALNSQVERTGQRYMEKVRGASANMQARALANLTSTQTSVPEEGSNVDDVAVGQQADKAPQGNQVSRNMGTENPYQTVNQWKKGGTGCAVM